MSVEQFALSSIYHYKYFALVFLLSLGLAGLPLPDEFLMIFSGFMSTLGHLSFFKAIVASSLGSFIGMNLSYLIGTQLDKLLSYRLHNPKIKNGIKTAEYWFNKYGEILIVVGYFFPGFRHFTAYFSGMSRYSLKRYMLLVALGAILWSSFFITMGKILGEHWHKVAAILHKDLLYIGIVIVVALIGFYFLKLRKKQIVLEDASDNKTEIKEEK